MVVVVSVVFLAVATHEPQTRKIKLEPPKSESESESKSGFLRLEFRVRAATHGDNFGQFGEGILLGIPDGGSWRAASTSAAVVRKKIQPHLSNGF